MFRIIAWTQLSLIAIATMPSLAQIPILGSDHVIEQFVDGKNLEVKRAGDYISKRLTMIPKIKQEIRKTLAEIHPEAQKIPRSRLWKNQIAENFPELKGASKCLQEIPWKKLSKSRTEESKKARSAGMSEAAKALKTVSIDRNERGALLYRLANEMLERFEKQGLDLEQIHDRLNAFDQISHALLNCTSLSEYGTGPAYTANLFWAAITQTARGMLPETGSSQTQVRSPPVKAITGAR